MDKTTTVDTVGVVTDHRCSIAAEAARMDRIPGEGVVDTAPLRNRHAVAAAAAAVRVAGLDSAMDSREEAAFAADSVGLVRRRDPVVVASIVVGQWSMPAVAAAFVVFAGMQPAIERQTKKVTTMTTWVWPPEQNRSDPTRTLLRPCLPRRR